MKNIKKILSLLLTIQMLFACTLVPSAIATDSVIEEPIDVVVEALVIDEGESSEELSPMMATARCDQYGSTTWVSLDDAMKRYGYDRNYVCTEKIKTGYNSDGTTYQYMQYYYEFSDKTKMYFGVVI